MTIQLIRNELLYQLDNIETPKITELSRIIHETEGNILFMGVGKSGNMAKHCADLLKCLSYRSYFIDIGNLLHGNIGSINEKDIIIMFSKSGNTQELINIIPVLKEKVKIYGICCNKTSEFHKLCNFTITLPFTSEIEGENNIIPTNSCMSQLLFCNLLVSILKKNVSLEIYKNNHPSGSIGHKLQKIKNVLITDFPTMIISDNMKIINILLEMQRCETGCCFFVDNDKHLNGILTDGDIRRLWLKDIDKKNITISEINCDYVYETDIDKYLYQCKSIGYMPVLDDKLQIIGIFRN